jgi:hypothetical protein
MGKKRADEDRSQVVFSVATRCRQQWAQLQYSFEVANFGEAVARVRHNEHSGATEKQRSPDIHGGG